MTEGRHRIVYQIEDIELNGGDGYGYWRALRYLVGFEAGLLATPDDYNNNGTVDVADFVISRNTAGQTGRGMATDGSGPDRVPDHVVDYYDYVFWRPHCGNTSSTNTGLTQMALGHVQFNVELSL